MLILTLRTDKPESEIGLYDNETQLAYEGWQAHRQLAETLHQKIKNLLNDQDKDWDAIEGIAVYRGPGSFTGLRIGLSVANALTEKHATPIMGATGDDWLQTSIKALLDGQNDKQVLPEYGADVHITPEKK